MIDFIVGLPQYLLSFVVILSVLVFVHEFGHYIVARWCGVRVETFSIGFGPELFGYTDRSGTRWKLSVLPLGGYVKMFGDTNVASAGGGGQPGMSAEDEAVAFYAKSVGRRSLIVAAGPAANYLFAAVLLAGLYMAVGQQVTAPIVGEVTPGSAAAAAGLEAGDRIVTLNGQPIERFEDLAREIQLGLGAPVVIEIERNGVLESVTAVPEIVVDTDMFGNVHQVGRLGVRSSGSTAIVEYSPLGAVGAAIENTYRMTVVTLKALGQMVSGARSPDEIAGVLRIAKLSGDVAGIGILAMMGFAAVLSVNLGLINLFPVPMLDGGHLAFYLVEAIRGRPLGRMAQEWGFRIGFALVILLFIFATRNDLMSFPVVADFIDRLMT